MQSNRYKINNCPSHWRLILTTRLSLNYFGPVTYVLHLTHHLRTHNQPPLFRFSSSSPSFNVHFYNRTYSLRFLSLLITYQNISLCSLSSSPRFTSMLPLTHLFFVRYSIHPSKHYRFCFTLPLFYFFFFFLSTVQNSKPHNMVGLTSYNNVLL